MRLALVGEHSELPQVVELIRQLPQVRIVVVAEQRVACKGEPFAPDCRNVPSWEHLLDSERSGEWDLLLFAGTLDTTKQEAALRRLARTGKPILVLHPVHESLIAAYESELFIREGQAYLAPWMPRSLHPLISKITEWVEQPTASPLGSLQSWTIERECADSDRATVLGNLARDLDFIRRGAGEISQVTALAGAGDHASVRSYSDLQVQLTVASQLLVRWSLVTGNSRLLRFILIGEHGRLEITVDRYGCSKAQWRHTSPDFAQSLPTDYSLPQILLETLSRALHRDPPAIPWRDAARTIELIDAVERSLKRGRKIEVRVHESDDLGNFKGVMASVGCGLLFLCLFILIVCAVAGVVLRVAGWEAGAQFVGAAWPWLMLLIIGGYLLIQLIIKISVKPERFDHPSEDSSLRS